LCLYRYDSSLFATIMHNIVYCRALRKRVLCTLLIINAKTYKVAFITNSKT